jgi:hypothetical protein
VGKQPKIPAQTVSIVHIGRLTSRRRGAIVKEEVHRLGTEVVKYSLAYVNPRICGVDNGRVLGYDNSHGHHHRHYMGDVSAVNFSGYEELLETFREELAELWRREDEQES